MYKTILCILSIFCLINSQVNAKEDTKKEQLNELLNSLLAPDLVEEAPTVLVALLVRNKAHVLPLFFTYFERLNYPKNRIALWIRSDHNTDNSIELLELWLNRTSALYHSVNASYEHTPTHYENETAPFDWTTERFTNLINLKEAAFDYGLEIWADYLFYLDADVILTSTETLKYLTSLRLPVVAPMLFSETMYSNFWCGMTDKYYYLRTDEYKEIYNMKKEGTFQVPMIHSAVLINLDHMAARFLTFDKERWLKQQRINKHWMSPKLGTKCRTYDGPQDDIIVFAISANCTQIPLFINNEYAYGYVLQPLDKDETIELDKQRLINMRANIVTDYGYLAEVEDYLLPYFEYPKKDKLTLERIFMINLERRDGRRLKMQQIFDQIGLDVELFKAIDGKTLNAEKLVEMNIKLLAGYEDPYHNRPMTMGEIGCFLSHYRIWERIVAENMNEVLILEDDIRFEPNFRMRALEIIEQARKLGNVDLIYFGRKRLKDEFEPRVQDAENLVHVGYSYWTLGYFITLTGAKKLLAAKPLEKLLPVDEFLPIMFGRHPNETWSAAFEKTDLVAFSASPLLLYPTHYTGDYGYISDTEDSELTPEQLHASARQANIINNDVRLKSDREVQFPKGEWPETVDNVVDLADLAQLDLSKTRDEF